jgi:hypothetical protein
LRLLRSLLVTIRARFLSGAEGLRTRIVIPLAKKLETVNSDLGRVPLVAGLVSPGAGAKLALNVNLRALADEFLRHIRRIPPSDDVVPFRVLAKFSIAVTISLCRGEGELGHLRRSLVRVVPIKVTYLRVSSNVTDQHYFVQ